VTGGADPAVCHDHRVLPRPVVVLSVLVVALLAGCGVRPEPLAPAADPRETPAELSAPPCPDSGVLVRVGTEDAAMGLRVVNLDLENCGEDPVTLEGYPGLRVLDADGAELSVWIGQGSAGIADVPAFDNPPGPVILRPGDQALSGIMWKNTNTRPGEEPLVGAQLEISPAPGWDWQDVKPGSTNDIETLHIDLGTTGELGVRAWTTMVE
jgi:hypothetical protein